MNRPNYNPLYWLSALGAGGLTVTFFIYLNFLVPHKGSPMATYEFIYDALIQGDWLSYVAGFSLIGIIAFALLHFKLLLFVIGEHNKFKNSWDYEKLKKTNAEVTLMAIPLTLTMTINVMFVVGAVFIPHLWDVVEYLFPGAVAGFAVTGYYAIKIFVEYFTRLIDEGDSTFDSTNNLSQMISIFTFTMVAVGFASPAAMSKTLAVEAVSIVGAIFFASMAILLILVKLTSGFQNMLQNGIGAEASPSLWIMIPILTLLGITFVRLMMGFEHNFKAETHPTSFLVLTTVIVSLQVMFGKIGYFVMRRNRYFRTYLHGDKLSVPSFALICPGVAFMVFWFFFVNFGFVHTHIVTKYSLVYFLMLLPGVLVQIKTIQVFFKLGSRFNLLNPFSSTSYNKELNKTN